MSLIEPSTKFCKICNNIFKVRHSNAQITSVLDGNVVYSNEPAKLDDLRSYEGGLMKTLPVFR